MKKIRDGVIKVTARKNPAFLYDGDTPGKYFDPDDAASGFLCGFLLKRVSTSPVTSLS